MRTRRQSSSARVEATLRARPCCLSHAVSPGDHPQPAGALPVRGRLRTRLPRGVRRAPDRLGRLVRLRPLAAVPPGIVTNPNMLLAGVIGRGKSALAKSLALRMTAFGVRVYVPGDPKGEWGPVAAAVGVEPIALGRGLPARINPLDPGPRPPAMARGGLVARGGGTTAQPALGSRRDHPRPQAGARRAHRPRRSPCRNSRQRRGFPVLPDVVAALMAPTNESARSVNMSARALRNGSRNLALELRRLVVGDLAGLFDGPTTRPLDFDAPIQVLDTSRLAGDDTAVALLMTCASAWMEAALASPDGGQRLVVYDEAWRMLRHLPLVRRMQAQWKLSRALGVANLAVVHRISDLGAVGASDSEAVALAHGLLADCSTRIVYAQETDQVDATAAALGLTDVEAEQLIHLPRGRGLWKIGRHSAIVDHILGSRRDLRSSTRTPGCGATSACQMSARPESPVVTSTGRC